VPSYSPVFSAPFIQYTSATPNTSFLVPAGFTAVARYGVITQDYGGYAGGWYIQDSEAAPGIFFDYNGSIGLLEVHTWEGRVVVPAGGLLNLTTSVVGSSLNAYLGGYLLRNNLT
jgi:hypothetical protein